MTHRIGSFRYKGKAAGSNRTESFWFKNVAVQFKNVVVQFKSVVVQFKSVVAQFKSAVLKFKNTVLGFKNVVLGFVNTASVPWPRLPLETFYMAGCAPWQATARHSHRPARPVSDVI